MHAPYDRPRKDSYRTGPKSSIGWLVVPALVALGLIALITTQPKASSWISQAVQAEFGGNGGAEDAPVLAAEPRMDVPLRTVRAQ